MKAKRATVGLVLVLVSIAPASPAAGQAAGEVVLVRMEIYLGAAPVTGRNFLDYVSEGLFDGGTFYRSVRRDNQPNDSVRIEVIQAGVDRSMRPRLRAAIRLERTRDHRNVDGQGFAVFGQVVEGMDVVRDIQMGAVEGQQLVERVVIESIRRVERLPRSGT